MASGLLSYRVLPFERAKDGGFKRPDDYPRSALAVITTHDLPTFSGWWRGLDIDLRQTLGRLRSARPRSANARRASPTKPPPRRGAGREELLPIARAARRAAA